MIITCSESSRSSCVRRSAARLDATTAAGGAPLAGDVSAPVEFEQATSMNPSAPSAASFKPPPLWRISMVESCPNGSWSTVRACSFEPFMPSPRRCADPEARSSMRCAARWTPWPDTSPIANRDTSRSRPMRTGGPKGGVAEVDEAEVARRYSIPGRAYADFAILRGDPSDGLPGIAGVGDKKAAELVTRYGSIAKMLEAGVFRNANADYLEKALRVVPPVRDLPIEVPRGRRDKYPQHPKKVEELGKKYGIDSSLERLIKSLTSR